MEKIRYDRLVQYRDILKHTIMSLQKRKLVANEYHQVTVDRRIHRVREQLGRVNDTIRKLEQDILER